MKLAALSVQILLTLFTHAVFADDWHHVVRTGDTLSQIGRDYLKRPGDWVGLQILNKVKDPRRLMPGERLRIPVAWLRQGEAAASVIHVRGRVVCVSGTGTRPVRAGDRLIAGESLETDADSNVSLRFFDGSRLLVAANSRFTLARLRQYGNTGMAETMVRLHEGSLDSRVSPQQAPSARYRIESQALNLGVRGTEFRIGVGADGVSHAEVLRGSVFASAEKGKHMGLDAGFGTVVRAGGTALPKVMLAPPPLLENLPARVERLPLHFSWKAEEEIVGWRAQVFPADSEDILLLDSTVSAPSATWTGLPDGLYRLKVRAIASNGIEGLNAEHVFVVAAHPEAPIALFPQEQRILRSSPVVLRWARPLGVSRFHLQVAANPDFTSLLVDEHTLGNTEYRVPLDTGEYFWRLASIADDGRQGPFGLAHRFTRLPPPASPEMDAPVLDDDAVRLRWRAGAPGETFRLQLGRDAEFTEVFVEESLSEPAYSLPLTMGEGSVFVRLQTIDADGVAGPYGLPQQIHVPSGDRSWLLLLLPVMLML